VAVICLALASKFDEIDNNIPMLVEFQRAFTGVFATIAKKYKNVMAKRTVSLRYKDLIECEPYVLNLLNWDLNLLSVYSFIQNFSYQGINFSSDTINSRNKTQRLDSLEPTLIEMVF
jgi:hypothetical protein